MKSFDEALKKLENFTLKGVASKVECSYLLTHGEEDAQITTEDAQKLFDEVASKDKTFKVFTQEEGVPSIARGITLPSGLRISRIGYMIGWCAKLEGQSE